MLRPNAARSCASGHAQRAGVQLAQALVLEYRLYEVLVVVQELRGCLSRGAQQPLRGPPHRLDDLCRHLLHVQASVSVKSAGRLSRRERASGGGSGRSSWEVSVESDLQARTRRATRRRRALGAHSYVQLSVGKRQEARRLGAEARGVVQELAALRAD